RIRRRGVEVVVAFLHVLAVIALGIRDAEEPLFQDRVAAIPQRQGQTEPALVVGNARDAIFAPAIGSAARFVVRKILPGGPAATIVLAHRPPLALRKIRSPAPPVHAAIARLQQATFFGGHGWIGFHAAFV